MRRTKAGEAIEHTPTSSPHRKTDGITQASPIRQQQVKKKKPNQRKITAPLSPPPPTYNPHTRISTKVSAFETRRLAWSSHGVFSHLSLTRWPFTRTHAPTHAHTHTHTHTHTHREMKRSLTKSSLAYSPQTPKAGALKKKSLNSGLIAA